MSETKIEKFKGKHFRRWKDAVETELFKAKCLNWSDSEGEDISEEKAREKLMRGKQAFAIIAGSIDEDILTKFANIKGDPVKLWNEMIDRYGTLSIDEGRRLDAKMNEITTDNLTLKDYMKQLLSLMNEYEDRGGDLPEKTRCYILRNGLKGKWAPLRHSLAGLNYDDLVRELEHEGEQEPERETVLVTKVSHGMVNCKWCGRSNHKHQHCFSRVCARCGGKGHYAADCTGNKNLNNKYASWVLDSGATVHVTPNIDDLDTWRSTNGKNLASVTGALTEVVALGQVKMSNGLTLNDVHCAPESTTRIISLPKLDEEGHQIQMANGKCEIHSGGLQIIGKLGQNGLYQLEDSPKMDTALLTTGKEPTASKRAIEEWHRSLAHLNVGDIEDLRKRKLIVGIEVEDDENMGKCEACQVGKAKKEDQDKEAYRMASHTGELMSCDVIDLRNAVGINDERYVSVITDHFSGYTSTRPIQTKSAQEILGHIDEVIKFVEQQSERNVKAVRSDNGLEYDNENVREFLKRRGIRHEFNAPYNAAGNGTAERRNRTLIESVRSIMSEGQVEQKYWPYALKYVTFAQNRTLVSAYSEKTPYETLYGIPPDVSRMKAFGSKCWALTDGQIAKLAPKATACKFLGFEESADVYIVMC